MKIIKFYGGLGNQMFQYAMLTAIKERWGGEVLMDTSLYSSYGLHNGFELHDVFDITAKEATPEQIKQLSFYTTNYRLSRIYHYALPSRRTEFKERTFGKYYPEVMDIEGDMLYEGYWQHWEYFHPYKEAVVKEFALKNPLDSQNSDFYHDMLAKQNAVSVHVRRGDFLNKRIYKGLCGKDYYQKAIAEAKRIAGDDADFYFFSNDLPWCRENLSDLIAAEHFHAVDWNTGKDSFKDMILMSACRVNIIANSSFSWWGAYLNQRNDCRVIAPEKWINKKMQNPIQLPEWTLL